MQLMMGGTNFDALKTRGKLLSRASNLIALKGQFMNETDVAGTSEGVEFLSFCVGGEDYAIDIGSTREIRSLTLPSSLSDAPAFVLAVIKSRCVVLPLPDLAARLGLSTPEVNERSVIVVAEIEETPIGLLVDGVSDIIAPSKDDMQAPPDVAKNGDTSLVRTLTFAGDKTVWVLDLSLGSGLITSI